MTETAPGLRHTSLVAVLPLAAVALAALVLAPAPIAIIGALALAVAIGLAPWMAASLVVLTLPYYLHPRSFGGIELSLTEATILLSVAGVLGRAIAERFITPRAPGPFPVGRQLTPAFRFPAPSPADWAAAAMLAAALLSLLVTEYPRQSLRELRWLIVEPLLLFYVARATLSEAYHVRLVLWSVVASGAIAALVALFSLVMQGAVLSVADRAANPYLSPNHLGLFLGRAGAVALALALFAPPRAKRASVVGLAAILSALLRTLSLGAWAGFGATAVALTALRGRRCLAATVISLLIVFLVGVVALPAGRTSGRLAPNTGTALFRLQIWSSSLRMIADHPVLGIGLDNFLYQYRGGYMLPEAADEPNISHPHNWVLNFWLELGLLGLVSALGILMWVARTAWRFVRWPIEADDRLVGGAAIGVFVDTLVHGSLDNSYFLVDAAVVWWLFVALLIVVSQRRAAPPNR